MDMTMDPVYQQIEDLRAWNIESVRSFADSKSASASPPLVNENEFSMITTSFETLWKDWSVADGTTVAMNGTAAVESATHATKDTAKGTGAVESATHATAKTGAADMPTPSAAAARAAAPAIDDDEDMWCPTCNRETRHPIEGYMICIECGEYGPMCIDSSAEWRFYGQEDSKSKDPCRCGSAANYLIPESGVGTVISTRYGESYKMRYARQYHAWNSLNYKGRNLFNTFEKLQRQARKHGIPTMIIEHAKQLYKKITDTRLFRGNNNEGLIAFCVYRACKDKGVPRSIKEIALIFSINEQVMTKGNRCFSKVFNKIREIDCESRVKNLSKPIHYIDRFCSRLHLPDVVVDSVRNIANTIHEHRLVADNTSASIAAASIYLVTCMYGMNLTKEDISLASKISEVTIGKCFKKLQQYEAYFIPFVNQYGLEKV
jgi:transcription initiation factor TFIIB